MPQFLCVTFRFLDPVPSYHGFRDGGEPEWPPSPLRMFQALVDAAANRWRNTKFLECAQPFLLWMERLGDPEIVTPPHHFGLPFRLSGPNNDMDAPARKWAKGEEPIKPHRPMDLRTMKAVLPTHIRIGDGKQGECLRYVFTLSDGPCQHLDFLKSAASSVTHLGWGIDMVAADADVISDAEAQSLHGERWKVALSGGVALRVPKVGTLEDLMRKHSDFLNRLSDDGFKPVPPLREFAVRYYRRSTAPEPRPYCIFQILRPDAKGFRPFDTARRTRDVAAWVRHAVADVCRDWPDLGSFVHGHSKDGGANRGPDANLRFQYLPLPTIASYDSRTRFGAIRRVLIAAPVGFDDRISFIRKRLIGRELVSEDHTHGLLNLVSQHDWVSSQYTGTATCWSSVTPVILDGFDDCNPVKTKRLISKALLNAGISTEAEFEWQSFGYRAGVEPANTFLRPAKLNGTMVHVRLKFANQVAGPMALGAGRFRGFGLMAIDNSVG